jgi:voltage-gated potassium channel
VGDFSEDREALMRSARQSIESPSYQIFILMLCLLALGGLAVRGLVDLAPEVRSLLDYVDNGVCVLFFADFLVCLVRAPDRWRYFITTGWLDLVSSVPAIDIARWGRAARMLRIVRVLRALRASKVMAKLILDRRAESTFLAASLMALLLIVASSSSVLHFESEAGGNIRTAEDALWWAFTTITTVGYGDRYPVTSEGRVVAVILMCAGFGLFGVFSGFLASWFLESDMGEGASEVAALKQELQRLSRLIEERVMPRSG